MTVSHIPPTVLLKLQDCVNSSPEKQKKKAFTILKAYAGTTVEQIQDDLVQSGFKRVSESRIRVIISLFNLRIQEPGFIDRFLKEDVETLKNEYLNHTDYSRQTMKKTITRKLTPNEFSYLDSIISSGADSKMAKSAKVIIGLSQGMVQRKLKEFVGTKFDNSHIASIRRRYFKENETVQALVQLTPSDYRLRNVKRKSDSSPPSTKKLKLDDGQKEQPELEEIDSEISSAGSSPQSPMSNDSWIDRSPIDSPQQDPFDPNTFFSEDY